MYRIYCLTSDKYIHAIRPLAYLMDKYWPNRPEVVVGGFTPPDFDMPDGFTFHSIGKFEDYPIHRWSDALIDMMDQLPDDVFMLMLEDMWPTQYVKSDIVRMCYDYMVQFEYVARLDLTGDRAGANGGDVSLYGKLGHVDLVWSDPHSQYHMSMMPAFWRKRHLQRVLIPGETPWEVELQGTPRLASLHKEMIVLGTNAWPYKNTLAFRGGDTSKLILDDINPRYISEMDSLGLFKGLN